MTVKNIRQEMGVTQKQFAQLLGVSVRCIAAYEEGWRKPSTKTLLKMAEVANLSEREILTMIRRS